MNSRRSNQKREPGFSYNNTAQLVRSGQLFFKTLEKLIDGAVYEIHFQTYIFAEDETGIRVADALIRAARRGVKIYMLLDAYGSAGLSATFIRNLKAEGIAFRLFGSIYRDGRFHIGRRLHRKLIVIDGITAIVSGINISNNYNSFPSSPPWLDFSVIVKGDVTPKLHRICTQSWLKIRFGRLSGKLKRHVLENKHVPDHPLKVRVRENDWKIGKSQVARSYYQLIRNAQTSLIIVGGYFLPGRRGQRFLKKAVARGVEIRLIVAGRSDVGLMRAAMLYLYGWILRHNIRIYEYRPSNVHGKAIVADRQHFSIGSYDLNTLSTYSNIELNLDVDDLSLASGFHDQLEEIIQSDCNEVRRDFYQADSSLRKRFARWLAYRLVKMLFVISIWLSRREKGEPNRSQDTR